MPLSDLAEYVKQSANKTASALIRTGAGFLYGLMVATDGTNDVTVTVYDNTTGSGTQLTPSFVVATSADDRYKLLWFNKPLRFSTGLYVAATSSGGSFSYMAYYVEG